MRFSFLYRKVGPAELGQPQVVHPSRTLGVQFHGFVVVFRMGFMNCLVIVRGWFLCVCGRCLSCRRLCLWVVFVFVLCLRLCRCVHFHHHSHARILLPHRHAPPAVMVCMRVLTGCRRRSGQSRVLTQQQQLSIKLVEKKSDVLAWSLRLL